MQSSASSQPDDVRRESPDYVRMSLAAAMTAGFVKGWFYRNARLRCINLLLTYHDGCKANCSFCGLAREKQEDWAAKKFIRVPWQTFRTDEVIEAIKQTPSDVSRVCISMVTHPKATADVLGICRLIDRNTDKAVSLLIAPTLLKRDDLVAMKDAGAERIGVAVDAATPEIFARYRGKPVKGPHRWDRYWKIYEQSLEVFGEGMAGVHLICGLDETEQELVGAISRARAMGGSTHLFSFFPEQGSVLESRPQPPIGAYRRIQLARWLIDTDRSRVDRMSFDYRGQIVDFGVSDSELQAAIAGGVPFETSGCPGPDGRTACNRPYGNEKPGKEIRNFPFAPGEEDLIQIRKELQQY